MHISSATITEAANYWHLGGCWFELSETLVIWGAKWVLISTHNQAGGMTKVKLGANLKLEM